MSPTRAATPQWRNDLQPGVGSLIVAVAHGGTLAANDPQVSWLPLLRESDEHHAAADCGYDAALATNHLLLMPTTPIKATPLPPADAPRELYVECALNMFANTAQTDISHHPAMAVPCRMSDGLPVSMMLIGKHFDEPAIYRAAYAFEQLGGARVALFSEF